MADLRQRKMQTKVRQLSSGRTVGGIPLGRGSVAHLLRNRFYIGEVASRARSFPVSSLRDCTRHDPAGGREHCCGLARAHDLGGGLCVGGKMSTRRAPGRIEAGHRGLQAGAGAEKVSIRRQDFRRRGFDECLCVKGRVGLF